MSNFLPSNNPSTFNISVIGFKNLPILVLLNAKEKAFPILLDKLVANLFPKSSIPGIFSNKVLANLPIGLICAIFPNDVPKKSFTFAVKPLIPFPKSIFSNILYNLSEIDDSISVNTFPLSTLDTPFDNPCMPLLNPSDNTTPTSKTPFAISDVIIVFPAAFIFSLITFHFPAIESKY